MFPLSSLEPDQCHIKCVRWAEKRSNELLSQEVAESSDGTDRENNKIQKPQGFRNAMVNNDSMDSVLNQYFRPGHYRNIVS